MSARRSWFSGSAAIAPTTSTIDESPVSVQTKGISVRSSGGIAVTSTASRPVAGIRLATPRAGSSVPSGSTSIIISSPGCTTHPGISALADADRRLSSTSTGIGTDWPGMSCTCVSRPSMKKRARTGGIPANVLRSAVGKTRSSDLSPATSGTGNFNDCTAWVRYAAGGASSPHGAIRRLPIPRSQVCRSGSEGAHRPVPPARNSSSRSRAVRPTGSGPSSAVLFESRSSLNRVSAASPADTGPESSLPSSRSCWRIDNLPSWGGIGPVRLFWYRCSRSRPARLPSAGGIGPSSWFSWRYSRCRCRLDRFPSSGGIGPWRSLS